jgi:hypothetical protein
MKLFVAALLLSLAPLAFGAPAGDGSANGYKATEIGALTDAKVPEAVRNALDSKGLRVVGEKGEPVCEIWFSKNLATGKGEVAGANFAQIGEGTFVGVINFPADTIDFRGQGLKPGYYTFRYGLIMEDGNHLGVSINRDFLLASPVADDKDPATPLKNEDLYKLSRNSTGTGHPSVWSLVQVSSNEGLPKVVKEGSGHVILETKIPTASGGQAIGLVVIGKTEG